MKQHAADLLTKQPFSQRVFTEQLCPV